jgi:hypothetical protein
MGGDGALGRAGAAASGGQQALDVAGAGGSGMGGSDAPRPTGELSCENGMPAHLPAHVELLATDVYEYQWTVSKNVLTTVAADPLGMSNSRSRTIRRQPLDGGNANTVVDDSTGINTSGIEALAADGADTVVREVDGGLPSHVAIRLLPSAGTVLNIALEVGVAIGKLVLDADSVYWMGLDAGQLTAWRTARAVADGVSLGSQAFDSSTGGTLKGPIAIGDWLYVATDKGQVLRASKSGATKLAAFGPALLPVRALATDDTDLLLMLDAMTDRLNNVVAPPRIVRMSSAGTVEDVTPIDTVGSDLAVNSGTIYWRVNQNTTPIWTATLWSAPADGSSAPTKLFTTPGNLLSSGLVAQQSSLYFAIYCRVDFGDNQVGGRTHILRYQP